MFSNKKKKKGKNCQSTKKIEKKKYKLEEEFKNKMEPTSEIKLPKKNKIIQNKIDYSYNIYNNINDTIIDIKKNKKVSQCLREIKQAIEKTNNLFNNLVTLLYLEKGELLDVNNLNKKELYNYNKNRNNFLLNKKINKVIKNYEDDNELAQSFRDINKYNTKNNKKKENKNDDLALSQRIKPENNKNKRKKNN